ncbi:MAG: hypothetical protein ACQEP1_01245 [Nanobdellota archaeon]
MRNVWLMIVVLFVLCSYSAFSDQSETGDTQVNITSVPNVSNVELNDDIRGDNEMDLTAGTETLLNCSADVTDPNGNSDIDNVSAEIYGPSSYLGDGDQDDFHYSNPDCTYESASGEAECLFPDVEFYAEPGEWHCRINATDIDGNSNASEDDNATMNELLAIDIPDSLLIDFGEIGVGETSNEKSSTYENEGNVEIDTELDVYNDSSTGTSDTEAMDCDSGSIPAENINASSDTGGTLTGTSMVGSGGTVILDENLTKATGNDSPPTSDLIYWRLHVPESGALGACTGKVYFGAVSS